MSFLGLLLILAMNVFLGTHPLSTQMDWSLSLQAAMLLADWLWAFFLLFDMEWKPWHDIYALLWMVVVFFEMLGMWWFLSEGRTYFLAAVAAGVIWFLRMLGLGMMIPRNRR